MNSWGEHSPIWRDFWLHPGAAFLLATCTVTYCIFGIILLHLSRCLSFSKPVYLYSPVVAVFIWCQWFPLLCNENRVSLYFFVLTEMRSQHRKCSSEIQLLLNSLCKCHDASQVSWYESKSKCHNSTFVIMAALRAGLPNSSMSEYSDSNSACWCWTMCSPLAKEAFW